MEESMAAAGIAILSGPTFSSLILTGLYDGIPGYRSFLARSLHWNVNIKWYIFALTIAPFSTILVLLLYSFYAPGISSPIFTSGNLPNLILFAVIGGLFVGIFEEFGWTGFLMPRYNERFSYLSNGLIVGLLWGAWHFILFWKSDSFS